MDKFEFTENAPLYYMIAIAEALAAGFAETEDNIKKHALVIFYDSATPLFAEAAKQMARRDIIAIDKDPFGPTLYNKGPAFNWWWATQATGESPIFARYQTIFSEERSKWLQLALASIEGSYKDLNLTPDHFDEIPPDEWEPIALDQADPALQKVEEALDKAIEQIESSNGYASSAPDERGYVVRQLKQFRSYLKTEVQIHWMTIKTFGLEPLGMAIQRFGDAAAGVAAQGAKAALLDWIKKNAAKYIDWLLPF